MNDVCSLQLTVSASNCHSHSATQASSTCSNDISDINYKTAVQKSSFERSISDSVVSLRNYSTILHTSNNLLYKTQSPNVLAKAVARQTSTPMHPNLAIADTPPLHAYGSACNECLAAFTASSNNSSSDSETSVSTVAKPNDDR